MEQFDPFKESCQQRFERERKHHLAEVAHQWSDIICKRLQLMGQVLWTNRHVLGLIPIHDYRVRQRVEPQAYIWWVEHDIAPYDKYQCAAYRVELILDEQSNSQLVVQSGARLYQITPITIQNFEITLAHVSQDPPLIIARAIGEAQD